MWLYVSFVVQSVANYNRWFRPNELCKKNEIFTNHSFVSSLSSPAVVGYSYISDLYLYMCMSMGDLTNRVAVLRPPSWLFSYLKKVRG